MAEFDEKDLQIVGEPTPNTSGVLEVDLEFYIINYVVTWRPVPGPQQTKTNFFQVPRLGPRGIYTDFSENLEIENRPQGP